MSGFERNLAIIIGINQYQNGISPLATAVNDAKKINELLRLEHDYKVWILLDEQATLDNITRLIKETLPQQITEEDRLLFYFAGHGIALNGEDGPEGYLIPQDAKLGDTSTYLGMTQLQLALNDLPCPHFLEVLDCCFAGAVKWSSNRDIGIIPDIIHQERYDRFITDSAWQVITSAASDQKAADSFTLNTERGKKGEHSPFAAALIDALQGKADIYPPATNGKPAGDGIITATELYLYLRDRIEPDSQGIQRQTPGIHPLKKHDKGEYIFFTPNHPLNLPPAPPLDIAQNPYRGLESFNEEHSHLFFGRDAVIKDLVKFVNNHPLTVVLGASGSGKSSLVKAGLVSHLRQDKDKNWLILPPIRLGDSPFKALNKALSDNSITQLEIESKIDSISLRLDQLIQQNQHQKILLIIDQFEELITLCEDDNERENFLNFLNKIIKKYSEKLNLVITLRSDFEPQFQDTPLKEMWQNSRFMVSPMTRNDLREAIEKPAEARVMYFQPHELVEQCIDEVADMPGALPLLSFALSELYLKYLKRQREAEFEGETIDRALTQEDYQELGGVIQSLTQRADQEYEKLVNKDPNYAPIICQVMLRMVAVSGGELARRRVSLAELAYPTEKNELVQEIIKTFTDSRLLVTGEDNEGKPYVEPAHDALVRGWQRLLRWKQENEESLLLQRRLTPAAMEWESQQKPKFLWNSNPRLDLLKKVLYSEDNWLNALESDFVKRSLAKRNFNTRRNWGIAIAVILGLSAGLIFSLIGQRNTLINQAKASKQSAQGNLRRDQSLDGMIDSLQAVNALKHPLVETPFLKPFSDSNELQGLQEQVKDTLQWAVYRVKEANRFSGDSNIIVRSVISPSNSMIASAGENGQIKLWDIKGNLLQVWEEGSQRVRSVTFSPDETLLVSTGEDGKIRLWDIEKIKTGKVTPYKEIKAHQGYARFATFSINGQIIASVGGQDGMLRLWNKEGKPLNSWQADTRKLAKNVMFHPNKKILITVGKEGNIKIWNLQGKLLQVLDYHAWWISFSPDGQYIVAAGDDGTIALLNYNGKVWKIQEKWKAHQGEIWNIIFSSNGQKIASGGDDGMARVWDLKGRQVAQFQGHTGPTRSVNFTKNGQQIISSGDDGTTRLWNISEQLLNKHNLSPPNNQEKINKIILNPKNLNQVIALSTINSKGDISIKDIKTRQNIDKTLDNYPTIDVNALILSPNKELLASAGKDGQIIIWNLQTGEKINTFQDHIGQVLSISFNSTSQQLVSAGEDSTIRVWDQIEQKNQGRYRSIFQVTQEGKIDKYMITDVIFSPDGQSIVNSDNMGYVMFWDLGQNQQTALWQASPYPINSLNFSLEGDLLVRIADQEKSTLIFPIQSLDELIPIGCQQIGDFLQSQTLNNVNSLNISLCNY